MDSDSWREDEEIATSPPEDDCNFSKKTNGNVIDSLDIKLPQATVNHHKSSSSRQRKRHSDRRNHKDEKEYEDGYRDKHKHYKHVAEFVERFVHVSSHPTNSYQENKWYLSCSSKEDFIKQYKKFYCGKAEAKELYRLILINVKKVMSEGNIDKLKKLSTLIDYTNDAEDQLILRDYCAHANNPIRNTNLVILACKYNKVKILKYLFGSGNRIRNNLAFSNGVKTNILPDDGDEKGHNAFYYAIRSSNIELLETLVNKWPDNYFTVHLEELDKILSRAYEELKLKNVLLSDKMEIFVENKLINLRFFSDSPSGQVQNFTSNLNTIKKRIELVLQNINLLNQDYSTTEKIDERFLFIAKSIAQNLHILKRQLKSTYCKLPWEEIEFCLVSFVSSYVKRQRVNLFYCSTLNKSKMLNHLGNFAKILQIEDEKYIVDENMNIANFATLPNLKREEVVAKIINNYPQFDELYNDYQLIRDFHSLHKINDHIHLALSVDAKEKEGQLIIIRVMQVIGEHLKNTLESPKLSNITNELLFLSLSKNTRKIIIDLRNSLSHAYSLSKRTEIEENKDVNFFIGIQNDTKKVGDVITEIFYNKNIKVLRMLLKKIIDSDNLDEIKEFLNVLSTSIEFDEMIENFKMEHKFEILIKKIDDNITDKTNYEKELLNQIYDIINCANAQSDNIRNNYIAGLALLKSLSVLNKKTKIDRNNIKEIKFIINVTLKKDINQNIKPHDFKEILQLLMKILHSVRSRMQGDNLDTLYRLFCEIYNTEFETGDIKWIEELRGKLNNKHSFIPTDKQRKTYENLTEEKYDSQLALKISELKNVLSNNSLSNQSIETFSLYKNDKKLKTIIEMYVLDIMSILDSSNNYLENNLLFLDDNTSLLNGKCLRNHLAHDNALIDILLFDPSVTVILNAIKLTEENIIKNKKKIGKLINDDPSKFREKYDQGLVTVINQEKMFAALQEGNLENVKDCIKKGADINARSINSCTTLHFAAKGPSLEVIKFILDQNLSLNVKDINGRSPLHVAAAYGRKNIVEFLIKEAGFSVDDVDNTRETALHIAAQNGHKDTVEILLENKANTFVQDIGGLSPLHYAISNSHIDVAKILLAKDPNVDINETTSGFTPLHEAAERGELELVNFLLQNKANINVRNDNDWTPLHAAAFNGHFQVVNVLILKGADVNARVLNGCTPLHYAIEHGHEKIAGILLKHGANVNAVDKIYNNTPLHYAAKDGYEEIIKILLKNKANLNVESVAGITPLHLAVQSGHLEIVTIFLKHGVNIHAKDKNNATPLHYAVENGHKEVVELLIKNSAQVNAKNNDDATPLHIAALKGHHNITDLLIKNKGRVNAQNINGHTPLHAAVMNGSIDIIDLLIKNKAEVNIKTNNGSTLLHMAVINGHIDIVDFLINNKTEVNARDVIAFTPLHLAVVRGYRDIVDFLIKNKAQVDATNIINVTPLHMAVEAGHKEIVEILIANGANVNGKNQTSNVKSLLCSAIKYNRKEIIEILIANGANVNGVNAEGDKPLLLAVFAGYKDIVEILLKNKACVNIKSFKNITPLHWAAGRGHKEIVNALITKKADIDAVTNKKLTPLHFAAEEGYKEIVDILIANGANVNVKSDDGVTPLHTAATRGYNNIVKVLLDNKANTTAKDNKDRISLELAVSHGRLQVVKMLLQYKKVDMNAKGNDNWTILHIASQENNLEMVKYLIDEGSDINAVNASGSKPIHIAAREGHKDTVEFFLSKGLSINDLGASNQTLLHYAAMKGRLAVVKYLIEHGADVNAKDTLGSSPMHIAANFDHKDVIEVLLKNGAVYNAADNHDRKPLEISHDKNIINLLASTEKLFQAVKHKYFSEVENCIKAGAFINAKNADNQTPLHYAAWKGCDEIVNILLQNGADSNAIDNKRFTPLHYAAKFSHLKAVKTLLHNGAVYNAISDNDKTPLDFTVDNSIISLFKLVNESFRNIEKNNSKIINDLNKIKEIDTIKAIMGARNRENKTLVVVAVHSKFSKLEQLKQISQSDASFKFTVALRLFNQGNYQKALSIFKGVFEKRKEILGPDNPGTLDIQTYIGKAYYAQGVLQTALNIFEEIFQKQKVVLGLNDKDTLSTRSIIALMLHRQEKDEEAFNIYQEVCQKQKDILGPNHSDTLDSQFHMALVLDKLERYEEALSINKAVFEKRKEMLNVLGAVHAQNNIAMVLNNQGKHAEALKIYKEVFEKKKVILSINHCSTLRTLHNIAGILFIQKKYHEALKTNQEVFNIQKNVLGPNHFDTLNTQYNIANMLFAQGKWSNALKAYRENFDKRKAFFEPSNRTILDILKRIEAISFIFKLQDKEVSEILQHSQKDINFAAGNGDMQTVQRLLKDGVDINHTDIDGRTPLHYAVSNKHISVVNILLNTGANVTQVTNKGNTPLHIATSKGYKEIVEVLLQHVNRDKANDFINAKTVVNGTTSLHVAAKNNYVEIVKSLMAHGAIYNIEDKEGNTPLNLSNDQNIIGLLKLIGELFEDANKGNIEIISKLKTVKPDELAAAINARNNQGNTLLQVAIANKYKNIASRLLEMLKELN